MKYYIDGAWVGFSPGAQGFSPSAKVVRTTNGAIIRITDKDGTTEVKVNDGSGGEGGGTISPVDELPEEGSPNEICYLLSPDKKYVEAYVFADGKWLTIGAPDVSATDAEIIDLFND